MPFSALMFCCGKFFAAAAAAATAASISHDFTEMIQIILLCYNFHKNHNLIH